MRAATRSRKPKTRKKSGAAAHHSLRVPRGQSPDSSAEKAAIRFRVPLGATTQFEDAVFGPREVSNEEIEDFVLLRSPKDGQAYGGPTYQLSVVVDDIEMRITHVIRGSDHISNTPKQALLYRALGAAPPFLRMCR